MNKEDSSEVIGNFSVALGLFDYINPIFYGITTITIMRYMRAEMNLPVFAIFLVGAILSLIFGLTIPTVKLIVGLGKMRFSMPVNLVSFVNTGILLSGIAISAHVLGIRPKSFVWILIGIAAVLGVLWKITGRFNTVAVLIGAAGYLMIYASLITLSLRNGAILSVALYAFAICLFIFLCFIGIKANLMNAKVHWVIEISNVLCQMSVAVATLILFFR